MWNDAIMEEAERKVNCSSEKTLGSRTRRDVMAGGRVKGVWPRWVMEVREWRLGSCCAGVLLLLLCERQQLKGISCVKGSS